MFSHSHNLFITGGTFTDIRPVEKHFHGNQARGLDALLAASAPGAFHNSGERFDPPKCHPKTRIHILTKIMDWIVGEVGWDGFIMWLHGPAGAGKSAIAQTIAERCHARHLLLGSFFFSRTDSKRNNEKCLIASIAYQIALNLPEARDAIEAAVERDPAIFQSSVQAQLTTLIIDPLTQLSKTDFFQQTLQHWFNIGFFNSNPAPYLIIIDGLDECLDRQIQQHILQAISSALQQSSVPLKFLICSRAEHHLTPGFTSLISGGMATCFSLDDGYERNADIERYLIDSFHKISTTHPLKGYIPPAWPSHKVLSTLVEKSSGQFIYAATVVKYISCDRHQPTRRLEIVLGMGAVQPSRSDLPFADLDALYIGILSSIEDVKATIRLLGVLILADLSPKTPEVVGKFMFLEPGEIQCLLLDLASVIKCVDKDTKIRMLHASFPDFLLDQSRSQKYYIDPFIVHAKIARLCLSHVRVHDMDDYDTCDEYYDGIYFPRAVTDYAYCNIVKHLSKTEPSAALREALLHTSYITSLIKLEKIIFSTEICDLLLKFLSFLKSSTFPDTEELYLHHRSIYDKIIHERIAHFSLDLGFFVFLVLIELEGVGGATLPLKFIDHFPAVEGVIARNYSTLSFDPTETESLTLSCRMLLRDFFTDPVRAGKYVLDGPKYALVAGFLLDCFIHPCSEHKFLSHFHPHEALQLFNGIETLLSKASYSDELIARINHTNLICNRHCFPSASLGGNIQKYNLKEMLRTLIKGIGDYLMRVLGSVPAELHIRVKTRREKLCYYYDTEPV